ncbi:hypothetical protein BHM03_00004313 [Ensete ventricosum]|nr:hypothetical protein BHM03_00004313 [Ensete ventricosum]
MLSSFSRTLCRKSSTAVLFLCQPRRRLPQPLPDALVAFALPMQPLSVAAQPRPTLPYCRCFLTVRPKATTSRSTRCHRRLHPSLAAPVILDPTSVRGSERMAATTAVHCALLPYCCHPLVRLDPSIRCHYSTAPMPSSLVIGPNFISFSLCYPTTAYALSFLLRMSRVGPPLPVMSARSFSARLIWPPKSTIVRPSSRLTTTVRPSLWLTI